MQKAKTRNYNSDSQRKISAMQIVKEDLEIDESDISYIIISIENLR
jgi:hypothetical protein